MNNIINFPTQSNRRWVSLPQNANPLDRFAEFEISGDSLAGVGINNTDVLLCRKNFDLSEVVPSKICIVLVLRTGDLLAKRVQLNDNDTATLLSANSKYPPKVYFTSDIQILALAIEARRLI